MIACGMNVSLNSGRQRTRCFVFFGKETKFVLQSLRPAVAFDMTASPSGKETKKCSK